MYQISNNEVITPDRILLKVVKKSFISPPACGGGGIEAMHFYRKNSKVIAFDGGGHNLSELKEMERGKQIY